MNRILLEDIQEICNCDLIDWEQFKNKKIFITGATGLIGSILCKTFLHRNKFFNSNIQLILLVRNTELAKSIFGEENIFYIENNIEEYSPQNLEIDYIIHAASPTKSKFFIDNPVETLNTAIIGTKNILQQARLSQAKSMVYLSSMEMYGILDCDNVDEKQLGYIDPLEERSSYSEGKRVCELYNYSFFKEYGVPTKIIRLAQTFGAGVSSKETRVYKGFADSVINKTNIILKSKGSTIINYIYTVDAIIGLLFILLNGEDGEAYNLVGDKTNMTILDSAKWLAEEYGEKKVDVVFDIPKEKAGFAPINEMVLSNEKMKQMGWYPKYDLYMGYDRLIKYLKEEKI